MQDFEYDVSGVPAYSDFIKVNNPLRRPEVRYRKAVITLVLFVVTVVGGFFLAYFVSRKTNFTVPVAAGLITSAVIAVVYVSVVAKRAVIWLVHLYQSKAPDRVRLRCVFEPSCSEYMILAVEKYGVIRGVFKGTRRLFRCRFPGGIDYP